MKIRGKKIVLNFKGQRGEKDDNLEYAKYCNGFTFSENSLKSKIGIDKAVCNYQDYSSGTHLIKEFDGFLDDTEGQHIHEKIENLFLYRRLTAEGYDDRLICNTNERQIYQIPLFEDGDWTVIHDISITGEVCSVCLNNNNDDILLFSSDNSYLIMLNDTTITVNRNAPTFSSMAFHNERVFASTKEGKNRVWFSDDFNPLNWNVSSVEGGYIDFRDEYGDVVGVVSFMDYIFVFKENAILRIIAYVDQTNFSVTKVALNVGRILKGSIVICGDMIYFLTPNGLYGFDGYSVSEIDRYLPKLSDYSHLTACGVDDKYYYASRREKDGIKYGENNILVEYDLKGKTYTIIEDIVVKKLLTVVLHHFKGVYMILNPQINSYICMLKESGKIFDEKIEKKWISVESNFDTTFKKVLKSINIYTLSDIDLKIYIDRKSYTYHLKGKDKYQRVQIGRGGYTFSFEISTDKEDCHIKPIEMFFDVVE